MLSINGFEFIIILVVVLLVIGPEKLPTYVEQLTRFIRGAREYVASTREKVVEDLGPEVAEIDWKSLDPRQYDPRKIIRDALAEEIEETKRVLRGSADDARKLVDSTDAMLKGHTGAKPRPNQGAPTVFDDEAT